MHTRPWAMARREHAKVVRTRAKCAIHDTKGRGGRTMKLVISLLALQIAIVAVVFSTADRADGAGRGSVSRGTLQGKIEYCKDCHGLSGQGYHGFLTMPRLAGQNPEYIENQLRAFI